MTSADWVAVSLLVSLTLYVLLGGADFGAGAWDWLCFGPRKQRQRRLIQDAIAPVWEANHVWLILALVILFTAFPTVFSYLAIVLHIPLTLLLLGIVFRGSAFVLRQYGPKPDDARWGRVFGISSFLTPLCLGILIGAVTEGTLPDPQTMHASEYWSAWAGVFPVAIGIFTVLVFMFLAAVYLTLETTDRELQDDFRARALVVGIPLCALISAGIHDRVSLALRVPTALVGSVAMLALFFRRYRLARALSIFVVLSISLGWGVSQYPYLIVPKYSIQNAAAPETTLRLLLGALVVGAFLLVPSLYWLMRIFKSSASRR